jgi:hypothetical protein
MLFGLSGTRLLCSQSHIHRPTPSTYSVFRISTRVYSIPIDLYINIPRAEVLLLRPATRDGDMKNDIAFSLLVPPAHVNIEPA